MQPLWQTQPEALQAWTRAGAWLVGAWLAEAGEHRESNNCVGRGHGRGQEELRQSTEMGIFDTGVGGKVKTFSGHVKLDG